MKTINQGIVGTFAILLASVFPSFGVVDQALEVRGTNLVLSWPSSGNEYYLIQYRPSVAPGTPWVQLTNCYHANSTNRTTFIIPCCVLNALGGGSGGSGMRAASGGGDSFASQSPESAKISSASESVSASSEKTYPTTINEALAAGLTYYYPEPPPMPPVMVKKDGKWLSVPFEEVYGQITRTEIKIPLRTQERFLKSLAAGKSFVSVANAKSDPSEPNNLQKFSNGGCDCPDMGFFRVWHIPDFPAGITNYTFDGPIFIPIDFKDYLDRVENTTVLLNGEPSPYAEFTPYVSGGQTNWGVGIYFDRITNGTYQIQLQTTLGLNEETGDNGVFLVLSNLTRVITVFNQVTFSDWDDFIQGDTYTFKAKTANPNTDWTIDIYDVWGNYVNSGSGHTTDSHVSWTWDLNDWQANNRDDFESDPYFYSEVTFATAGNGPTITKPTPFPVKGFPNRGEWLTAFQDRWFSDAPGYPADCQTKWIEAMSYTYGGPILIGDTSHWLPIKFGTNVYTQSEREQSWAALLDAIGDLHIRNFFYDGHGGATSLGCDRHILDTNGFADGGVFSFRGSKSQIESWQIAKKTKYNRYRFVFIDGCSSASGDLPNAFNISKTNHNIAFYENHPKHPRPSVYVGWSDVIGGEDGTDVYKWLDFEKNWMGIWANGSGFPSIKTSLESANSIYGWLPSGTFNSKIRIYGYQEMVIRDYNRKGDWRWP